MITQNQTILKSHFIANNLSQKNTFKSAKVAQGINAKQAQLSI